MNETIIINQFQLLFPKNNVRLNLPFRMFDEKFRDANTTTREINESTRCIDKISCTNVAHNIFSNKLAREDTIEHGSRLLDARSARFRSPRLSRK